MTCLKYIIFIITVIWESCIAKQFGLQPLRNTAQSGEELKSLLMKVKKESEKNWLETQY